MPLSSLTDHSCGLTGGKPMSQNSAFEAAEHVLNWTLKETTFDDGKTQSPIFLWGYSLAGAFCAHVAAKFQNQVSTFSCLQLIMQQLAGCIFDNTFSSPGDVIRQFIYLPIPVSWIQAIGGQKFDSKASVCVLDQ